MPAEGSGAGRSGTVYEKSVDIHSHSSQNEVLCVRLSKIRHIRNNAPYHDVGKRLGPITSALMKIVISKSQINARALMTNHAHILNNREGI
jgi:hypothetical protein